MLCWVDLFFFNKKQNQINASVKKKLKKFENEVILDRS